MRKKIKNKSESGRIKRHYRIRKNMFGTKDKPRLIVHRSNKNIYAQLIDDTLGATLLSVSTVDKAFKKDQAWGGNVEVAKKLGSYLFNEAKKKGIGRVVFDRGGYLYHGRVKAFAEAMREAGLKF